MRWPKHLSVKSLPLKAKLGVVFFAIILILAIADLITFLNDGPTREMQKWNDNWMKGGATSNSQDGSR